MMSGAAMLRRAATTAQKLSGNFSPWQILKTARRCIFTEPVPPEAFAEPSTVVSRLSNGLRVATQWAPGLTATVGVFIDSGSRYETKETNGVAHFLEHMLFKGTQKRSRESLEKEIENMGAHLNAYTAREQTVYYAKLFKKDVPQGLDLLSDVLTNSKLEPEAMEEEKHVILREMEEVQKSYDEVIFDRIHMAAFPGNSLGFTILGPEESIKAMKREHILQYITENYRSDRMVLVGVGDLDHKQFVQQVEDKFSAFRPSESDVYIPSEKPCFYGGELKQHDDRIGPIDHFALAFEGVEWSHPEQPVFMVMQAIIGSYNREKEGVVPGTASGNRIINACAHKLDGNGCIESYSAFNTCYKDTGLFGFYLQAEHNALYYAYNELLFGITALSYSITDEEVARAKNQLKTVLFGSLDNTTNICEDVGRQLLVYGRRIPLAELFKRIDAVDAEEVKRVAWTRLHDRDFVLAGVGKLRNMRAYVDIRRKTFWYRY